MTCEEFIYAWTWSSKPILCDISGVFRCQSKWLVNWSLDSVTFLIDELHQLRDVVIGLGLGDGYWCPLLCSFAVLCPVSDQTIYRLEIEMFKLTLEHPLQWSSNKLYLIIILKLSICSIKFKINNILTKFWHNSHILELFFWLMWSTLFGLKVFFLNKMLYISL